QPSQDLQRVAEIIVGFGKGWPESDRFFITAHGFVKTLETSQGESEKLVRIGGALVDFDGTAKAALRIREPALLQPQLAHTAQRAEMAIVPQQHRLIELFGLAKTTVIVQQNRLLEDL